MRDIRHLGRIIASLVARGRGVFAATAKILGVEDADGDLAVAQYRALSRNLPLLYFILLVNSWCLVATHFHVAPRYLTIWVPSMLTLICGARLFRWYCDRNHVPSPPEAVRRLKQSNFVATLTAGLFVGWGVSFFHFGDLSTNSHVTFFVAFTTLGCIVCLMQIRATALRLALVISIPFIVFLAFSGNATFRGMAINYTLVIAAMMIIAVNTYGDFASLVASRSALLAKQSEIMALSDENLRLANMDSLTGLANRRNFFSVVDSGLSAALERGGRVIVGVLDLDGFKTVNDAYGHSVGDSLLVEVAARLAENCSGHFLPHRLGGDEFALISIVDMDDQTLRTRAEAICEALSQPVMIGYIPVQITATLGLATYPESGETIEELFERADYTLYHAKRNNRRGKPILFNSEHRAEIRRDSRISQALRSTELDQELDLAFHPIINSQSGVVVGFEALARWNNKWLGPISPANFIPIAERIGMISKLTRILLQKALAVAATWPAEVRLSFNLSVEDVSSVDRIRRVISLIEQSGVDPRRLDFEITETAMVRDFPQVLRSINMLKAIGSGIALDDFGNGYSNLSQVHRLPLDKIKIDRGLISGIDANSISRKIVKSVMILCRDMEIDCVVEGVENNAELDALRELGCHLVQGYCYTRPISRDDVPDFLSRWRQGTHLSQRLTLAS